MEPYLVCVFLRPTQREEEEGKVPEIVVKPELILARDSGLATAKALGLVPDNFKNFDDRLEVRCIIFQKTGR